MINSRPAIALLSLAFLALSMSCVLAQQPKGKGGGKGKGGSRFADMEKKAIAESFVGVTADGKVEKGLFEIKSTGVSTKEVREAAKKFIAELTDEQKKKSMFPVDDDEWRRWANQHSLPRQGVSFEELNEKQRKLAFEMIGAGLSARGLKTSAGYHEAESHYRRAFRSRGRIRLRSLGLLSHFHGRAIGNETMGMAV